jgi:hypothetical protein
VKFEAVRSYALSLAKVTEEPHFELTSFRVGGKIFATAPADGSAVNIFVGEEERVPLVAANPQTFENLYWGKVVCGIRVNLPNADSKAVKKLLLHAWARKAPKRIIS